MAKTRRNRTRRGGGGNEGSMKIGGKSRRRRGGQAPAPATTGASNLLGDIGSGAKNALDKTKEGFSWALNKVFPGSVTTNPPVQPYALGGRRKRRGGSGEVIGYTSFQSVPASIRGGSRRKRRGGQVEDFDENWNKYGSVGGSRRRKKRC
jgi:hypothetical protein